MVLEKAIVVRALTVFQTFKLNFSRLLLFILVDFFHDVELKYPNNVCRVLDVVRLLETLE